MRLVGRPLVVNENTFPVFEKFNNLVVFFNLLFFGLKE